MRGRFILAIKYFETDNETFKARFVVQERTDSENHILVHQSSNTRQQNVKLIISMAAIFGYSL